MEILWQDVVKLIENAAVQAASDSGNGPEPELTQALKWPISCTVGPGLEGAIACETKVGYVNGTKGWLVYRGHDIFDLCAHASYEEVCFLLIHGKLPNSQQLTDFRTPDLPRVMH